VIAGQTGSSDFPLVNALISQTEPRATAGFIAKVNPSTGQILFSTRIGGLAVESFVPLGSVVNAVAVDPTGNIYAAGWTNAADFPVSANAFQKSAPGATPSDRAPTVSSSSFPPAAIACSTRRCWEEPPPTASAEATASARAGPTR
jgi:hypothetical protein